MQVYPVFIPNLGCPQRCVFCSQGRTSGRHHPPEPGAVSRWLDEVLPEIGAGEVAFYGGSFTAIPESLQAAYLNAARPFVEAGRVAGIRLSTRPDALCVQRIERLRDSRVTTVEVGCQSFDDEVLTRSGRGHTADAARAAVGLCREAGLRTGLQLMPGLPGGDAAEARASVRTALGLAPSFLRIYPAVVVEGTRLADLWRSGGYRPWPLEEMVEVAADLLDLCRAAGVPVLRIGLQNEASLADHILAGPWHPAFGQLVKSRLWRRAIMATACDKVGRFRVNPVDLSDAIGHRRDNLAWFDRHRWSVSLVADESVGPGVLLVQRDTERFEMLTVIRQ